MAGSLLFSAEDPQESLQSITLPINFSSLANPVLDIDAREYKFLIVPDVAL